ncbi:DUF6576 domain-containing protein [Flavobacterium sp. GP15]|uniref:DUF6576 domain-containing protein n=1 Tax=Flavobacterium sp. GP15 TaxID=2758567 RepID=UPI00165D8FE0|nr:DUF6576 domain-containing protein [Flavobacterium sp. GP15]
MKKLKIDLLAIRNIEESPVIEDTLSLLKYEGIFSEINASILIKSILLKELNPLVYNSLDKVWLLKIPCLINPFLIGLKFKQPANEKKTKFEFNPEFSKILTYNKPLEVQLNECIEIDNGNIENYEFVIDTNAEPVLVTLDTVLAGTSLITIDISKPNLSGVLKSNKINPSNLIKTYHKQGTDNVNTIDLNDLRKEYVDRVTFYKINGYFLLVGYSKKAKERKRIFNYNNGFVKYITSLEDFNFEDMVDDVSNNKLSVNLSNNTEEKKVEGKNRNLANLSQETILNRILDKIGRAGTNSLTEKEKLFLNSL